MLRAALLLAAVLALAPAAHAAPDPLSDEPDPQIADGSAAAALADARDRWRQARLRDYDFRVEVLCFCSQEFRGPHAVRVRDGRARRPGLARPYATVPKLFGVVAEAIADGVASLEVRYGATGLPRLISIDVSRATVDEERTIRASRLRPR